MNTTRNVYGWGNLNEVRPEFGPNYGAERGNREKPKQTQPQAQPKPEEPKGVSSEHEQVILIASKDYIEGTITKEDLITTIDYVKIQSKR